MLYACSWIYVENGYSFIVNIECLCFYSNVRDLQMDSPLKYLDPKIFHEHESLQFLWVHFSHSCLKLSLFLNRTVEWIYLTYYSSFPFFLLFKRSNLRLSFQLDLPVPAQIAITWNVWKRPKEKINESGIVLLKTKQAILRKVVVSFVHADCSSCNYDFSHAKYKTVFKSVSSIYVIECCQRQC